VYSYASTVSNSNKSSSHPNFTTTNSGNGNNQQTSNMPPSFQPSASREKLNQFSLIQQQQHTFSTPAQGGQNIMPSQYHRHSLNNLMPMQPYHMTNRRNSSNNCDSDRLIPSSLVSHTMTRSTRAMSDQTSNENVASPTIQQQNATSPTASDINSRLESLCRQMTEQAIN
jgi:hypothetical protein